MLRLRSVTPVAVLVVLAGAACGVSEETDRESVRTAVTTVLGAAARDDLAAAMPALAPWAWTGSQAVPKPWGQLSKQEQDATTASMWNLVKVVPKESLLRDPQAIGAAIAAGTLAVRRGIRQADLTLSGPAADGGAKPATFRIGLALGNDDAWRVTHVERTFGR